MKQGGQTYRARTARLQATTAAVPAASTASFGGVMTECMERWPLQQKAMSGALRKQLRSASRLFSRMFAALNDAYVQKAKKRLCVAETVSLGEKRFVALLKVDGQEFLIGGGSTGVSVLAMLESSTDGREMSKEICQ